jgi:VanZ family protein
LSLRGLWLPAAWASVILVLTSVPGVPTVGPAGFDKVAHFAMYFVLAVLCSPHLARSSHRSKRSLYTCLAILLFAAIDELHQLAIPGRAASVGDWLADAAGAIAGLSAAMFLLSWRKIST